MNQNEVIDISHTIVPKSDQLNADQLIASSLTITVTRVTARAASDDQPVSIFYEGDKGRPYKPCLTMRKLLAFAWSENAATWIGRAMTLYHEPSVTWGGAEVGGIRISHMSDIKSNIKVSLAKSKTKKELISVQRMDRPVGIDHVGLINAASNMAELEAAFKAAFVSTKDAETRAKYVEIKDARKAELSAPTDPTPELADA
jgi:hypothetical protein